LKKGFAATANSTSTFDPQLYLESVGASRRAEEFGKKQAIFSQGDAANSVLYVQKGSVKLTVVNESGKEAVVAIFGPGDFFGEGGMAGRTVRMGTATAMVPTTVLIIGKDEMVRALHAGSIRTIPLRITLQLQV
jgi:CRP/FNR family transcriptional regulator, cyclic AMP receptor protein